MTDDLLDEHGYGRDPMTVGTDVLAANGHPKSSLSRLRSAYARTAAGKPDPELYPAWITTYRAVRSHCMDHCAESAHMVRKCEITCCPLWPYRTGRNPHSDAIGKTPANFHSALVRPRITAPSADAGASRVGGVPE